jgi:hypothetical protein
VLLTDLDGSDRRGRAVGYLSLFASIGTLVCCALPSLLVLLGFGAAVASVLTSVPWLVTLSRHKDWVFAAAALALVGNAYLTYRVLPRWTRTCPPNAREACEQARRWSRGTLIASVVVFLVGWFVAFALGPLLERFAR